MRLVPDRPGGAATPQCERLVDRGPAPHYTIAIMSSCRTLVLAPLLLAACSAAPWTVRIENARDVEVPLVQCAVLYADGGTSHTSNVVPGQAVEFAAAGWAGTPEVELEVFWLPGKPPSRARITGLDASTDGITVRLRDPQVIELHDRQGNDAAVLDVAPPPNQ